MSMKDLNEEIKRIKQLFTEERLYGNLVNDKIINEHVSILKSTIDNLLTKIGKTDLIDNLSTLKVKKNLESISTKIKGFDNTAFIKYIDDINNGFKSDLKDALKSGFVDGTGTVLKSKSVDDAVDGIVDILTKEEYIKDIKNGTLNFDKLGEETKSLFKSIDGFEDVTTKNIKKIKTKNIPKLTPESKKVLIEKMKGVVGSNVSKWYSNGYSNFTESFFAFTKSSPWKVGWGKFFKTYAKMQSASLAANLVTLPLGLAKDFIRTQIICPLLDPASNYPDDFGTDATGKLNETTISEQNYETDGMSGYKVFSETLFFIGRILFTPVGADLVSILAEYGVIPQRSGIFNWEGYGCDKLPKTVIQTIVSEFNKIDIDEEKKNKLVNDFNNTLKEGDNFFREQAETLGKTELTKENGEKITLQQLIDASKKE